MTTARMMPSSIEPPRATPELEIVLVVQRASTTPSGTGFDLRRRVHRHSNARAVVRGKVAEDEPDENRDCESCEFEMARPRLTPERSGCSFSWHQWSCSEPRRTVLLNA